MAGMSGTLNKATRPRIAREQAFPELGNLLPSFTPAGAQSQVRNWSHGANVRRKDVSPGKNDDEPIVYVIDDDPSTIESMRGLLQSVRIGLRTFRTPEDFLSNPLPDVPGCLVMDTRLPGQSGLGFQRQLTAANFYIPVVFIARHSDVSVVVRAMKAGAVDFLTKPFRDQELLDAVMAAIEQDRIRRTNAAALSETRRRFASLTDRERQIMNDVVSGWMNKQIAARINLSEVTVKVHRGNVMRKMCARSLAELVKIAGLLEAAALCKG